MKGTARLIQSARVSISCGSPSVHPTGVAALVGFLLVATIPMFKLSLGQGTRRHPGASFRGAELFRCFHVETRHLVEA